MLEIHKFSSTTWLACVFCRAQQAIDRVLLVAQRPHARGGSCSRGSDLHALVNQLLQKAFGGPLLLNGCRICRVYATTHQKQKKSVLSCQMIPSLPVCSRDCLSSEFRGISAFPSFWSKNCPSCLSTNLSMPTSYGTLAASDWQVQSHLSPSDPKPASFSLRFTRKIRMCPSRNYAELEEILIFLLYIKSQFFFHEILHHVFNGRWYRFSSLTVSFSRTHWGDQPCLLW